MKAYRTKKSHREYMRRWRKAHAHYSRDWDRKNGVMALESLRGSKHILGIRVRPDSGYRL